MRWRSAMLSISMYKTAMIRLMICTLLWMLCLAPAAAQRVAYPGGKTYIYRVYLTDKQGTEYSLRHPEAFLSPRALARRERQHLAVDSTDLPVSARYLAALRDRGLQPIGTSKWNNTVLIRSHADDVAARAEGLPFVRRVMRVFVSPDSVKPVKRATLVADSTKASAESIYGEALAQITQLGGVPLHEAGFRGQGMRIGIIDGGYMNADRIPSLAKARVLMARDMVYPYGDDVYGELSHGMMVLSCMAAVDSHKYMGTAPEAEYLLLRSEYGPTESLYEEDTWAMAAEVADSAGVDVINSSLGYALFDDAATSHKYAELDGVSTLISRTASMLAGKGIVLVCSAGNSGNDPWKKITPPGDARDVLTVGAVNDKGMNTNFSSLGPSQDGRVKPDIMARGGAARIYNAQGCISKANGTSFASPIACGLVACLWQALPDKTAQEIIDLVRRSGDRHATPDNVFGYGIPDFWKAYQMGR